MYRLEKLQKKFFTPMPRSVQWTILDDLGMTLLFIYDVLYTMMSNSESPVLADDTKAKMQSHTNKLNKKNKERTIETKLVIMADASSKNNPTNTDKVEMTNCNVHARREFKDVENQYRGEVDTVVGWWKEVYKNEAYAKENDLKPKERLLYHQEKSTLAMNDLKKWCESSLPEKRVEPNSPLGKAVTYVLRHWPGLTGFLRIEGCPLDTNILEGDLRTPVMNRKNWLHLKTEHGALINDVHLSVVRSCELSDEDPFLYLNTIQENASAVRVTPEKWLPWNYKDNFRKCSLQ